MITLTAQMSDASTIAATFNDDGTFAYASSFVMQPDGFYFPGLSMSETTPLASAAREGTTLFFRIGAASWPAPPYGQDYQEFRIDTITRQGRECFIGDGSTVVHCRSIVTADFVTTAPESHQVPMLPGGWMMALFLLLVAARMVAVKP